LIPEQKLPESVKKINQNLPVLLQNRKIRVPAARRRQRKKAKPVSNLPVLLFSFALKKSLLILYSKISIR